MFLSAFIVDGQTNKDERARFVDAVTAQIKLAVNEKSMQAQKEVDASTLDEQHDESQLTQVSLEKDNTVQAASIKIRAELEGQNRSARLDGMDRLDQTVQQRVVTDPTVIELNEKSLQLAQKVNLDKESKDGATERIKMLQNPRY